MSVTPLAPKNTLLCSAATLSPRPNNFHRKLMQHVLPARPAHHCAVGPRPSLSSMRAPRLEVFAGSLDPKKEQSPVSDASARLDKRSTNKPHTIIQTEKGEYELLNTLTPAESAEIKETLGLSLTGKVVLGQGAFGKVRIARNLATGEFVAVKKITNEKDQELTMVDQIPKHKNLLPYLDAVMTQGSKGEQKGYIFMPLLTGGTLIDKLPLFYCSDLTASQLTGFKTAIAKQTLEGLLCLHDSGLAHRDIKPENIMFDQVGTPILTDFGLTHRIDRPTRAVRGTPDYFSPEMMQHQNVSRLNAPLDPVAQDHWAIGVSLMELELGRRMDLNERMQVYQGYPDDAEDLVGLAMQFMHESGEQRLTVAEALQQPVFESDDYLRFRGQYGALYGSVFGV